MKKYISDVIIKPLVTEKSQFLNQNDCYVFEVNPKSNRSPNKALSVILLILNLTLSPTLSLILFQGFSNVAL